MGLLLIMQHFLDVLEPGMQKHMQYAVGITETLGDVWASLAARGQSSGLCNSGEVREVEASCRDDQTFTSLFDSNACIVQCLQERYVRQ